MFLIEVVLLPLLLAREMIVPIFLKNVKINTNVISIDVKMLGGATKFFLLFIIYLLYQITIFLVMLVRYCHCTLAWFA